MFQKRIVFALFFTTLFFLTQQNIFACSCGSRPTVLDEYENSELIIIAKAVSVEKADKEKGEYFQENIKLTKMIVEKVYKGNVKVGEELSFGQGSGSDCGMIFEEEDIGKQFIFYLSSPEKPSVKNARPIYYVSFCGKSAYLNGAANDLLFLDNVNNLRGKTRVSGDIYCNDKNCPSPANIEIKFIGENKTFSTKTDKKGFYQIYDIPAGLYLIEAKLTQGWRADDDNFYLPRTAGYIRFYDEETMKKPVKNQFYIELRNKGHIEFDFFTVPDNSIRGKVFSPVGKPMQDVCVSAVASETMEKNYGGSDCTNEKGEYIIEELSPGNYFLIVNNDGKMSSKEPFGAIFYPGVADKQSAGLISIDPGKFITEIDIQIPKMAELIEISGRFLYSDGTPVADDWVYFKPSEKSDKTDGEARAKTDVQGRFSIKTLKGLSGKLSAGMYIYDDKYEDCPDALKALEKTGKTSADVKTNEIEISGNENMSDVKLVLPFPNCEKRKD